MPNRDRPKTMGLTRLNSLLAARVEVATRRIFSYPRQWTCLACMIGQLYVLVRSDGLNISPTQ